MNKFKVGDKVRIIRLQQWQESYLLKVGDIVEYSAIDGVRCPKGNTVFGMDCNIELINNEQSNSSINKVGEIMSDIKSFVKNLALSANEKLLRKHGFRTDTGAYTDAAKDYAMNQLCKKYREDMIVIAKKMEAETKK